MLLNVWPVLLKIVQVFQNKESLRNCHSLEKPQETLGIDVVWYLDGIKRQKKDIRF